MYQSLKEQTCQANLELTEHQLVIYSWGNVSAIDRDANVVAIKPSGIDYNRLTPEKIVVLDLDGNIVEGELKPSSDTPTHLELYRNFKDIGGICHTHSTYATMWAQACKQIPCLGTTHADYFYGPVPLTEIITAEEIENDYELNTGKIIIRRFKDISPLQMPAVLVAGHGPFTWGTDAQKAVQSAVILEQVAKMAAGTMIINSRQNDISPELLVKHFLRKHGKDAYYGQERSGS